MKLTDKQKRQAIKDLSDIINKRNKVNIDYESLYLIDNFDDFEEYFALLGVNFEIESIVNNVYEELKKNNDNKLMNILSYLDAIGCLEATKKVAACYYNGYNVSLNYNIALEYYEKAAKLNDSSSECFLGLCYFDGKVIEKDLSKALYFFKSAANHGEKEAQFILGLLYYKGIGVEKNITEAMKWYLGAAISGNEEAQKILYNYYKPLADEENVTAMYYLAICYERGFGVNKDMARAYGLYMRSANEGFVKAMFNLALCYEMGEGTKKNLNEALYWYKKAAELDDADAQYNLAVSYKLGEGVEKDFTKAVYWYKKAAEQGDCNAQNNLGYCYKKGEGVSKDIKQAVYWFSKAANQDNESALYNLALCYKNGDGVDKNLEFAFELFKKAAKKAHPYSLFNVAEMYNEGHGVKQSILKAHCYYLKAIKKATIPEAYYALGYIYFNDKEITQDLQKAKYYFEKALQCGFNCEYPLKMVKIALGEIEGENPIGNIYLKSKDYFDFMNSIEGIINSSKLDNKSKTFIMSGLEVYFLVNRVKQPDKERDYSNIIISFMKAFEMEINKYFVKGYIDYLRKEHKYERLDSVLKERFTLGSFRYFIGLTKADQMISTEARRNQQNNYQFNDSDFYEYLQTLFDLNKFNKSILKEDITNYMCELVQNIEDVNRQYRNPSAHKDIMTLEEAEATINFLLFNKKVLFMILEKIK